MQESESSASEKYSGPLEIEIDEIPSVKLQSIELPSDASAFRKFAIGTKKREFILTEDWKISVKGMDASTGLDGVITIPAKRNGEQIRFDGASVPVPWLISFLSIGSLRPLGVMLIPSIVHDHAFMFGELLVSKTKDDAPVRVEVKRHDADTLFYRMIKTFNGDPVTAWLAYGAVRLGWLFGVKYNGHRRGGKPPIMIIGFALLALASLGFVLIPNSYVPGPKKLSPKWLTDLVSHTFSPEAVADFTDRVAGLATFSVLLYIGIYLLSLFSLWRFKRAKERAEQEARS